MDTLTILNANKKENASCVIPKIDVLKEKLINIVNTSTAQILFKTK